MSPREMPRMPLAKWSTRMLAWIIDVVLVTMTLIILNMANPEFFTSSASILAHLVILTPVYFAYWVVTEYMTGQSIGKRLLNIRVVGVDGGAPSLVGIMLSSFGKSFILIIDLMMISYVRSDNRQRGFSRIGGVMVVDITGWKDG